MSTSPGGRQQMLSPELRHRLQADLRFQRATGTAWLLGVACLALAATAFAAWLGLRTVGTVPTLLPMFVTAVAGLVAVIATAWHRRRRTAALRAVLAAGQVVVLEGRLDTPDILPATQASGRGLRVYALDGQVHRIVAESPGSDALLGGVAQQVRAAVEAASAVRLVVSAGHAQHLLQVEYPGLPPAQLESTPMDARDWADLMARPRAALGAAAWLGGAMLLGLAVLAGLPAVSGGFSLWLGAGLAVLLAWLLVVRAPAWWMWLRRAQVRGQTIRGPIQEMMLARRYQGRQGVEYALLARLDGRWHLLQTAATASALHAGLDLRGTISVRYAVLGDRHVLLRYSAPL
ncbi:hypothetical protein [Stenotrophomonas rhizophila]|uniref:hypothetical protein n=1 Tax=Stenotrophomonas rhizophila TaxID=216778 RepID=UPI001E2D73B0|nr:hypothetical protein [Stenotrophomonas rhizophila]MCC7634185.1 hypothetical protein [Stenotrophomonas rhizophila]MCC7662881.1 hypothetical protein [Stenotrophomonas rhizophila]